MSRARMTIMRAIRLQLKSGFLKEEPAELTFLKRYPPINRETKANFHKLEEKNVPYLDLLDKAIDRNPVYDERVYPAYRHHEPIGLTLVKKQYQYMQAGDDEATALRKAEDYVGELENKAYEGITALRNALKKADAKAPFMRDEAVAAELANWQERVRTKPYLELELAEQGEIDYFIQTKILKWNEAERERRMRDPVFASQFRKLRKTILTSDPAELKEMAAMRADKRDAEIMAQLHDVDYTKMRAAAPFYLEDYVRFFNMFKEQPNPRFWKMQDRALVTNWLINCVATSDLLTSLDGDDVRSYLDVLKHQFFPMSFRPEKADSYEPLTVDSLRKALYQNDVGYLKESGKVWVRRYYKIPSLLFPVDSLAAHVLVNPDEAQRIVKEDDEQALIAFIGSAGADEAALPAVKALLQEYVQKHGPVEGAAAEADGRPASPLTALMNDAIYDRTAPGAGSASERHQSRVGKARGTIDEAAEESTEATTAPQATAPKQAATAAHIGADEWDSDAIDRLIETLRSSSSAESDKRIAVPKVFGTLPEDSDEESVAGDSDSDVESSSSSSENGSESDSSSDSDSDAELGSAADARLPFAEDPANLDLVRKYRKLPANALDRARDRLYGTDFMFAQAEDEDDLDTYRDDRLTSEYQHRARLEKIFAEKEAARRAKEWQDRHMWKLPRPSIPVIGVKNV